MFEQLKPVILDTIHYQAQALLRHYLEQEGVEPHKMKEELDKIGAFILDKRSTDMVVNDTFGFIQAVMTSAMAVAIQAPTYHPAVKRTTAEPILVAMKRRGVPDSYDLLKKKKPLRFAAN